LEMFVLEKNTKPDHPITHHLKEFLARFQTVEIQNGVNHLLLQDKKSQAFYITCHLDSKTLCENADLDAVLDPIESEEYKLNRNIYVDSYAYKRMEADALGSRTFEDIVVEYDTSYRPEIPLKVFGGQHRITALREAVKKGVTTPQGIRVYFVLSIEQKFEIATVSNTAIAVSNDLLDRMQEELLGSELREWCQSVGLLDKAENFADRRNPGGIITVRIARTLLVNFFDGKSAKKDTFHQPEVCSSGTSPDKRYLNLRKSIKWSDVELKKMGEQFGQLHRAQRDAVAKRDTDKHMEYANKAIHPSVTAAWAYAAGLFQGDPKALKNHYDLSTTANDPLNAKALSEARLKGTDPDTYRGLGARINGQELGRMFAVFLLQATKAEKRGINLKLANLAIRAYQVAKTKNEYEKALKKGI
jgi:hypothetical protein